MTNPDGGPHTISQQEREALAAVTAEWASSRQQAAEAKTAAAAKRRRMTLLGGAGLAGVLLLTGTAYGISQAGTDTPTPVAPPTAGPALPVAAPTTAPTPGPTSSSTSAAGTSAPDSPISGAPTPAALTPVQQAEAEAEAAYRKFVRVDNAIGQAGYRDTKPYDEVAVIPERRYLEEQALESRKAGERQVVEIEVREVSVVKSDLEPGPGNYPYVIFRVCEDLSGVDVVDRTGKSTVSADRPDTYLSTVTVNRYQPGTPGVKSGGWRVYSYDTPGAQC